MPARALRTLAPALACGMAALSAPAAGAEGSEALEYPADYHEQWIDVTGLQGRVVFVQRVDPRNAIRESDETNNVSPRITLRLPPPGPASPPAGARGTERPGRP